LNFPHSDPDYYSELVENDDEQEKSTQIWQPDIKDHGFSPEDLEVASEEEPDKKEDPEGEFVHSSYTYLWLT
jgi:hypothetical protein